MFEREEILPPTLEYFELLRRLDEKLYANNDFDDSLTPSEAFQTKMCWILDFLTKEQTLIFFLFSDILCLT